MPIDEATTGNGLSPLESDLLDTSSLGLRDPRVLTLSHYLGDSFEIPWILCSKWAVRGVYTIVYETS